MADLDATHGYVHGVGGPYGSVCNECGLPFWHRIHDVEGHFDVDMFNPVLPTTPSEILAKDNEVGYYDNLGPELRIDDSVLKDMEQKRLKNSRIAVSFSLLAVGLGITGIGLNISNYLGMCF